MTTQRPLTIALGVTAILAILAIVLSSLALVQQTTLSPTATSPLSGAYTDGAADRPHFVVVLTTTARGNVRGALDYENQDGQMAVVFTFRGTSQASRPGSSSGVVTLEPVVTLAHASGLLSAVPPPAIAVTYGPRTLEFGECVSYLRVATLAACVFAASGSGVAQ